MDTATNHPHLTTRDVEERLRALGEERRAEGRRCLEHPGPDPRIQDAATRLVKVLYGEGDFGPNWRSAHWLMEKADELALGLQATYEHFQAENCCRHCQEQK